VSYAQNREDVVLHRALKSVSKGCYVEVGANDPTLHSISRGFYEIGWSGLTIDPVHEFIHAHRQQRPEDTQVEAAITDADVEEVVLHQISGTGLSTLDDFTAARHLKSGWDARDVTVPARRLDEVLQAQGWADKPVHFLIVDVEGAEQSVLASIDLTQWRPWILVIEATQALSTEPAFQSWEPAVVAAGYSFKLFDGLSRFYVAAEHEAELGSLLSYPACVHDDYVEHAVLVDNAERDRLLTAATELTTALGAMTATSDAAESALAVANAERDRLLTAATELTTALGAMTATSDAAESALAVANAEQDRLVVEHEVIAAKSAARHAVDVTAIVRWRGAALGSWSRSAAIGCQIPVEDTADELKFLRNQTHYLTLELSAIRTTLSWRVTKPLRLARKLIKLLGR